MKLQERFPKMEQIYPVYGLITLFIYGWSLYIFSWRLPSWLMFLNVGELGTILAYTFVVNFLETIFAILLLLIIAFILPSKWFRDNFILIGSITVICLFSFLAYISVKNTRLEGDIPAYAVWIILFVLIFVTIVNKFNIRKIVEIAADRAVIFIYITVPLTIISLVVIIIRNL